MKKRKHISTLFKGVTINKVIKTLVYSDLILFTGWGFINPILAIFFTDKVSGGDVTMVGIAMGMYFLVKSLVQIPVARYIDLEKGELDDFWILITGSIISTSVPFIYLFVSEPWHVYAVQILHGLGAALSFPPWPAIFTRHIDEHEEGLEWSIYYSATDLGTAVAGAIGGFIAATYGYEFVMLAVGLFSIMSTFSLFHMKNDMRKRT
ncbi:MFS transporter [Patescibacteria group bacterium]|nr:MFS transporter [Patescibacteria group bacterium]